MFSKEDWVIKTLTIFQTSCYSEGNYYLFTPENIASMHYSSDWMGLAREHHVELLINRNVFKWVDLSTERIENFYCYIQEHLVPFFSFLSGGGRVCGREKNLSSFKILSQYWGIFVSSIERSEHWGSYTLLLLGFFAVVKFYQLVCKTTFWNLKNAFSDFRVVNSFFLEATSCT